VHELPDREVARDSPPPVEKAMGAIREYVRAEGWTTV
jgi:hypothetical protein